MTPDSPVGITPYRPCWAEINTGALRRNWQSLKSKVAPGVDLLAVVKADGYGHGLLEVSRVAVDEGARILGVSSLDEGLALRDAGIQLPVLILGSLYPFDNFPILFEKKLTPTVASLEAAVALHDLAKARGTRLPVHLKIDSGFGRIGVQISTALEFIRQTARLDGLDVEGLYTHFSSSDVDAPYTQAQADTFWGVVQQAQSEGVRPRWIHLANSSALLRFPKSHGTLARPGLAFYGIAPFAGAENVVRLEPALAWKSKIIFLKTIPEGSHVSYARTWTAERPTRVATLAIGYADGYPRILSNKGQVLIGGRRVPVIGRVTMDMTMVDVTDIPEVHVGDEVVILGAQGNETMTAGEMAEAAQTNAYEILCRIAPRVTRVYRDE